MWSGIVVGAFSRVPARRSNAGLATALRGRGLDMVGDDSATAGSVVRRFAATACFQRNGGG
jgi:hypothetical protein